MPAREPVADQVRSAVATSVASHGCRAAIRSGRTLHVLKRHRSDDRSISGRGQWRRIVSKLNSSPVDHGTDLIKTADQVLGRVTNRSIFVLISIS